MYCPKPPDLASQPEPGTGIYRNRSMDEKPARNTKTQEVIPPKRYFLKINLNQLRAPSTVRGQRPPTYVRNKVAI